MQPNLFILIWSDYDLKIIGTNWNACNYLPKLLSYTQKQIGFKDTGSKWKKRDIIYDVVKTYYTISKEELVSFPNLQGFVKNLEAMSHKDVFVIGTYQGLIDRVVDTIKKHGDLILNTFDTRTKFPEPDFSKMGGFRGNQEWFTRTLVAANRSGIGKAPTRYGKTTCCGNILRCYPLVNGKPQVRFIVSAPGVNLLPQLSASLHRMLPDREIKDIYSGSKDRTECDDINIVSPDSLHKIRKDAGPTIFVGDETHCYGASIRSLNLNQFVHTRYLSIGATDTGRFSGNDIVIEGLFGPRLVETTYKDCVELGMLCPIEVSIIRVPYKPFRCATRDTAYKKLVYNNKTFAKLVDKIQKDIIPQQWQTLIFISTEKQGDFFNQTFEHPMRLAMDKTFKGYDREDGTHVSANKERLEFLDMLEKNDVKRCLCSSIYSTGVTIPEIKCIINCQGGGGSTSSVQKPGRLAEIKPNKKAGYLIDFLFEPIVETAEDEAILKDSQCKSVNRDCLNRIKSYKKTGYKIEYMDSPEEIRFSDAIPTT